MEDNHGNKLAFEDTNMFNFGTELELKVKKATAEKEPEWQSLQNQPGIVIWRIENFSLKRWPENLFSSFYDGDSYIVLITTKLASGELAREAHMWVGKDTTADESGTAAFKIVELDDFFDRKVTLVWNSQGNETPHFLAAFGGNMKILHGGVNSGFKKVVKECKATELFEIFNERVIQMKPKADSLTSLNAFVLDSEEVVYLWRGSKASHKENFNAARLINELKALRAKKVEVVDVKQGQEDEGFWALLGGKKEVKDKPNKHFGVKNSDEQQQNLINQVKRMCRISDDSGEVKIEETSFGKESLSSDDVFLVQNQDNVLLWIGKNSSKKEKIGCMLHAKNYVKENSLQGVKIFIVNEDYEPHYFSSMF
jgi:gelsolin